MIKAGEDATTAEDMNAMIADLKSAQKALVLAPATLTYAVVGKSVVSGVTASAAKVTVTVDGKTYTATADDVTGAFTVATSALKGTSTIKVDATRNGVNGTYSYAMKNGNIESGFVPTSPTLPTQPTTSTQPTTATQPKNKIKQKKITVKIFKITLDMHTKTVHTNHCPSTTPMFRVELVENSYLLAVSAYCL